MYSGDSKQPIDILRHQSIIWVGCVLACAYCYASFSGRLVSEPVKE
jgi:DNA repair photolyase